MDFDYLYKIILVGDMFVGKTSLVKRFKEGQFTGDYRSTIGVDFTVQTLEIGTKRVKLQIWDTSGQERFRAITPGYYRNAHGSIVVYDITDKQTLENGMSWLSEVQSYSGYNTVNLLVGNKADLESKRQVTLEEARQLTSGTHGLIGPIETSAKTAQNVDQTFYKMAEELMKWNGSSTDFSSGAVDSISLQHTRPPDASYWPSCCSY